MPSYVSGGFALDASAVLALLLKEPGHENVHRLLGSGWIHAVNAAEVIGVLMPCGTPKELATVAIPKLQLDINEEFTIEHAQTCGVLLD